MTETPCLLNIMEPWQRLYCILGGNNNVLHYKLIVVSYISIRNLLLHLIISLVYLGSIISYMIQSYNSFLTLKKIVLSSNFDL